MKCLDELSCKVKDWSLELSHRCIGLSLQVLEAIMKNCGNAVHNEVASHDFMEFFKEQANVSTKAEHFVYNNA